MTRLSYKMFMNEVRQRLADFSEEELRTLILEWAAVEFPDERVDFLNKLKLDKQDELPGVNADVLLDEIEAFAINVENGAFVDGYGWGDDFLAEREFGDESWAWEMDSFFLAARNLLQKGYHDTAEKAYRKLFAVLELGEEPGYLPGDPSVNNMLEIDLREHIALFYRSVYVNAESNNRVNLLYEAMNEQGILISPSITLTDVSESLDAPLPGFRDFLKDWIIYLKEKPAFHVNQLLREAVLLKGGTPAIKSFARTYADKFPEAYIDWISALQREGEQESVLQVAVEGLEKIPGNFAVRADVAEKLTKIGDNLHNNVMKLKGLKESFYSDPSLKYLLDLYILAEEENCLDEVRDEAERRMNELRDEGSTRSDTFICMESRQSELNEGEYIHALILGGNYEKVFDMCQGKGALGWSSSAHPKPVMLTFLMDVLSKNDDYSNVLKDQWQYVVSRGIFGMREIHMEKYNQIIKRVKHTVRLSDEQEEFYLTWCRNETGRRIDAIVSNKYRRSYDKAAKILVVMAETLANRGSKQEGQVYIEKYRKKYSRFSAFRREIDETLDASGL